MSTWPACLDQVEVLQMARNAGLQVRATKCNNFYLIGNCRRGRLGPDGNKKNRQSKAGKETVWSQKRVEE